jgi:hypothetical protein
MTVKPEKVNNPYGSTAGAGSGEFHVYRHARAREMERLRNLDDEEREKELDQQFAITVAQYKDEVERKTEQRRKKRQRYKEAKTRKKNLERAGIHLSGGSNDVNEGAEEDDFDYDPNPTSSNDKTKRGETSSTALNAGTGDGATKFQVECSKDTASQTAQEPHDDDRPRKKQHIENMKKKDSEC